MKAHRALILLIGFAILIAVPFTMARSEAVLRGTVERITHPDPAGTHVWLRTSASSQEVCLGDSRYLENNSFTPKTGDSIQVSGTREGALFVADSIVRNDQALHLSGPASSGQATTYHSCYHGDRQHHRNDHPVHHDSDCYGHDCEHDHHHCDGD